MGAEASAGTSARAVIVVGLVGALGACSPAPSDDEERFAALLSAFADGDCEGVFAARDQGFAVETAERADAAHLAIGVCEYRADAFADAASTLEEPALRSPPFARTPRAAYYRARSLQRSGDLVGANAAFAEVERRFSPTAYGDDALYHHGRVALGLHRPDDALARFQALAARPGVDPGFQARALYGSARAHQQRAELTSAMEELENAIALYRDVRSQHPLSDVADNALYREGKAQRVAGRPLEAVTALDALVVEYPHSRWAPAAVYQKGRALLEAGDLEGAAAAFLEVIEAYPDRDVVDNARYRYGRVRYALGVSAELAGQDASSHLVAAEETLTALRAEHPTSPFLRGGTYYRGRARYRLGRYLAARDDMVETSALGPSSYDDNAAYYLALSDYHLADEPLVYQAVAEALATLPTAFPSSSYLDNAAYFRGRALEKGGLLAEAAEAYLAMAAAYSTSSYVDNALSHRVRVLLLLGDCAAARATLEWLVHTVPTSPLRAEAEAAVAAACP